MASFHRKTACLALFLLLPKYPNPFGCHGLCHSLNFIVVVLAATTDGQGAAVKGPGSQFSLGVSHTQAFTKSSGTLSGLEDSASDPENFFFDHQHL